MTSPLKSPAEPKSSCSELDRGRAHDSSIRAVLTDLPLDLDLVEDEAELVFAHLRELLSDFVGAKDEKGGRVQ